MNSVPLSEVAFPTCNKVEPKCGKGFTYGIDGPTKCQGTALSNWNLKMKYLTPIYLTLMHAFKDAANRRLNNEDYQRIYDPIGLMHEFGTLRIDGGRQTGKTEAAVQFANDWLLEGGSVIILSTRYTQSNETVERIKRMHNSSYSINKLTDIDIRHNLIPMTMRSFLSDTDKFRGRSLGRCLIVIEEPMKVPELDKFYQAYMENVRWSVISNTNELPLFFVIGMQ